MNDDDVITASPCVDPTTPEEWQEAVDAARGLLTIDAARQYGLVVGGPVVDVERCHRILGVGESLGYTPRPDAAERTALAFAGHG